jgi:hypothetical protein
MRHQGDKVTIESFESLASLSIMHRSEASKTGQSRKVYNKAQRKLLTKYWLQKHEGISGGILDTIAREVSGLEGGRYADAKAVQQWFWNANQRRVVNRVADDGGKPVEIPVENPENHATASEVDPDLKNWGVQHIKAPANAGDDMGGVGGNSGEHGSSGLFDIGSLMPTSGTSRGNAQRYSAGSSAWGAGCEDGSARSGRTRASGGGQYSNKYLGSSSLPQATSSSYRQMEILKSERFYDLVNTKTLRLIYDSIYEQLS